MNNIFEEIYANEQKYREYITNHRNNVQRAWKELRNNIEVVNYICNNKSIELNQFVTTLDNLIQNHDMSKYGREEFDAYRKWFYPINDEEKQMAKFAFDQAWKHHYTLNLHHWDWWYEIGISEDMPFVFVMEMICDWIAMGYQFNNTAKDWYYKNKDNIHLGSKQTKWVEDILELI